MINKKWCDPRNISILSCSCSPHLEHLSIICRPFYLPREFPAIIATAIYIPPQADTGLALSKLHDEISGYINKHPDAASIIAGDFNKANLRMVMQNFHQHVSCPTRGPNTLDHCYTQFKNAYKARSLPALGKSDHAAIFLTPEYKQRIVQESPGEREVTRWSSHSEAMLQASLDDVDWDMFRASSADVSEFTDVALSFVNMLTDQATETVTIRTFSNQKPWVDRTIRAAVNQRTATTTPVFCQETWAITKHCAMLSDGQLELLNSDTERELSHIFSSMTLDACGRDWRPSVPLEITPLPRWEQIHCWPKS